MSLSTKLVTLRKQKGLTQMDLAEKLQVSRQAISRWEVGAAVPSTENLKVLGDLYGVSIDYLLNDISDNIENQKNDVADQTNPLAKKKNYNKNLGCISIYNGRDYNDFHNSNCKPEYRRTYTSRKNGYCRGR